MSLQSKLTASEAAEFLNVSVQSIHKTLKVKNLVSYKGQNRVFFGHETSQSLFKIKFKKQVIAFQIVKGGTGKTSLAHAFAIRANLYGCKVLCIDLDQQGNLTQAFNIDADEHPVMIDILREKAHLKETIINISPGLDVIPSRIENATLDNIIMLEKYSLERIYNNMIAKLQEIYDLIIIDCPPALGQSVAAATLASDIILAPLTPEKFSLSGLHITHDEILSLSRKYGKKINLKVVLNKFDSRKALSSEVLTTVFNDEIFHPILCKTFIRISQEFPNTIYNKSNIFHTLKNTSAKEDIDLLTKELLDIENINFKSIMEI